MLKGKVLHIWNTAGVASLMSKELNKRGYKSRVISRSGYDPFGIARFYGDIPLELSASEYITKCIREAEHYDIIHVHALYSIIPEIRKRNPKKKILLQYHGTELTQCKNDNLRRRVQTLCDHIVCSTHDLWELLKEEGTKSILIDNAVDTDHFKFIPKNKFKPALTFNMSNFKEGALSIFVESCSNWEYVEIDRNTNPVMYSNLPDLLNKYDKYIDVKIYKWATKPHQAISKTGREALSCGLKVLNYKGEIVRGLPTEYTPEYMIEKLIEVYEK